MPEKDIIILQDKKFTRHISREKISKAVKGLGRKLSSELKKENPVFICILNGAFVFAADLLREFPHPCSISFVKLSSYQGTSSSGKVKKLIGLSDPISNRTVVVVEDIIDSGCTIENIYKELKKLKPKKILTAAMFFKPGACVRKVKIDYLGMEIPNDFIIGYGLDYNGMGRNYKNIYIINQK